ncbi:MAG: MFS transporter [Propionibacteriaceae bacterium]
MRLIRQNGAFRALFVSRTVSYLGDALSLVVLMLYVADVTGQALAVAALLLVGDFAPSLLAPWAGAVSDRFDLRRVMVVCDLVQAVLVGCLALFLPPLPVLLLLVGLRALTAQVFGPASRSAMPFLVAEDELPGANSTLGLGTNLGEVLGPLLAAALYPLLGVRGVLAVDAATFLLSAAALSQLPHLPRPRSTQTTFLDDARTGLHYVWRTPAVRAVVLGFCAVVLFNGVDDVAVIFLVRDSLTASPSAAALALAGVGIGLLAGFAVIARQHRLSMVVLFVVGLALNSAGNLLTGLSWAVAMVLALQIIRGVGIAGMDVGSSTLLQTTVPTELTGRVFGNLYGLVGISAGLSYVLGGLLLNATSPRTTFLVAGGGGLIAAALTGWRLSRPREAAD